MRDSVTVEMAASPATVWALVSDITNTGRWSPEVFEAKWMDGATGPAVGVRFRGHVRRNGRGPVYWTQCRIIACEPEREFAFAVVMRGRELNIWRYQFEPTASGVAVTESFDLRRDLWLRMYWAVAGHWRNRTNVNGMRQTLERIKDAAEAA
jgi:uncharacterized protein YndB with AHSA1/START domain